MAAKFSTKYVRVKKQKINSGVTFLISSIHSNANSGPCVTTLRWNHCWRIKMPPVQSVAWERTTTAQIAARVLRAMIGCGVFESLLSNLSLNKPLVIPMEPCRLEEKSAKLAIYLFGQVPKSSSFNKAEDLSLSVIWFLRYLSNNIDFCLRKVLYPNVKIIDQTRIQYWSEWHKMIKFGGLNLYFPVFRLTWNFHRSLKKKHEICFAGNSQIHEQTSGLSQMSSFEKHRQMLN